jgi:NCS1 nucleoside transporter family
VPQPTPSLFNPDLAPVPLEKRTWKVYDYASLWVAMSVCIPTYMLASGLIAGGMNRYCSGMAKGAPAVLPPVFLSLIVLMPMLLNAHAGAKYGIPFPVLVRSSFGVRGANLPALLRALVACGWFGIQTWIGGQADCQSASSNSLQPHFWFRAKPRQSWRLLQWTEDFAGKWKAIAGTRRPRTRQRFARCLSS